MKKEKGLLANCVLCSFLSVVSALLYLLPYRAVPQFEATFRALDSELPLFTQFIITIVPLFAGMACVSVCLLLVWVALSKRSDLVVAFLKASVINVSIATAAVLLSFVAVYLPVFLS